MPRTLSLSHVKGRLNSGERTQYIEAKRLVNVSGRMGLPREAFSFTEKHGIYRSQDWQAEQQRELTSTLSGLNII